jgi:hypothetical protein
MSLTVKRTPRKDPIREIELTSQFDERRILRFKPFSGKIEVWYERPGDYRNDKANVVGGDMVVTRGELHEFATALIELATQ